MPITNYEETSRLSTELLQKAISSERSKNWAQAILAYKKIICFISTENLPADYIYTDHYRIALYETYFHLGLSYQQVGEHELALVNFSKAIHTATANQFGCSCYAPDSLAVPAYCRKAQSYSALGKYKAAIKNLKIATSNAEKDLDMLCMEALIYNTFGEYKKAMRLLVRGLGVSKSHIGCRMLRKYLKEEGDSPKYGEQKVEGFDGVTTFHHPDIMDFIERHLQTMNVAHTVEEIKLETDNLRGSANRWRMSSCHSCQRKPELSLLLNSKESDNDYNLSWKKYQMCDIFPFKAGALPSMFERDPVRERDSYIYKQRRRDQYGRFRREQAANMKFLSPDEFTKMLEDSKSKKRLTDWNVKKAQGFKGNRITLAAFPPVSTQKVPRLYPKPWRGDRLNSAPLPIREKQPIFYPAFS
ncbi:hypothetical protein EB796_018907 [Bugula neritina]|uniref:Uncharacterized protein n=1 Tax=Bugula neritina TaxID=10212 RepID=A0A7J7J9U7_BUGNE|nr:hypothetical protein EB796_018907 [Bugula neritina]